MNHGGKCESDALLNVRPSSSIVLLRAAAATCQPMRCGSVHKQNDPGHNGADGTTRQELALNRRRASNYKDSNVVSDDEDADSRLAAVTTNESTFYRQCTLSWILHVPRNGVANGSASRSAPTTSC